MKRIKIKSCSAKVLNWYTAQVKKVFIVTQPSYSDMPSELKLFGAQPRDFWMVCTPGSSFYKKLILKKDCVEL